MIDKATARQDTMQDSTIWEVTRFRKPDGSEIKTVQDVADTTSASAFWSDVAELWGVTLANTDADGFSPVVCYTGNGPGSRAHANLIVTAVNSHDTLTARVRELEEELRRYRCASSFEAMACRTIARGLRALTTMEKSS